MKSNLKKWRLPKSKFRVNPRANIHWRGHPFAWFRFYIKSYFFVYTGYRCIYRPDRQGD